MPSTPKNTLSCLCLEKRYENIFCLVVVSLSWTATQNLMVIWCCCCQSRTVTLTNGNWQNIRYAVAENQMSVLKRLLKRISDSLLAFRPSQLSSIWSGHKTTWPASWDRPVILSEPASNQDLQQAWIGTDTEHNKTETQTLKDHSLPRPGQLSMCCYGATIF